MIRFLLFISLCMTAFAQPLTIGDPALHFHIAAGDTNPFPSVAGLYRRWEGDMLNYSNGALVSNWVDSVASSALKQSTSSKMPIWTNGNSVIMNCPFVSFDYVDDSMTNAFVSTNMTHFFMLANIKATNAGQRDIFTGVNDTAVFYIDSSDQFHFLGAGKVDSTARHYAITNWLLFEILLMGADSDMITNGISIVSGTRTGPTNAFPNLRINTRYNETIPAGLDLAAFLVYTNAAGTDLSSNDVYSIRHWFKVKYGIPPQF